MNTPGQDKPSFDDDPIAKFAADEDDDELDTSEGDDEFDEADDEDDDAELEDADTDEDEPVANKGHAPLKGTDTPAHTDLEYAERERGKRTTM